jgi:hypothetical protein
MVIPPPRARGCYDNAIQPGEGLQLSSARARVLRWQEQGDLLRAIDPGLLVLAHEGAQVHRQPQPAALVRREGLAIEPLVEVPGQQRGVTGAEGSGHVEDRAVEDGGLRAQGLAQLDAERGVQAPPAGRGER